MSKGLFNSATSLTDELIDDSSTASSESSASPLSNASNGHPFKFEPPSIKMPEVNHQINEYKDKLKSLNALLSPIQLFNTFDLLITNYQKLKKEYTEKWKLQQPYRQQLRSILKHNNTAPNHSISLKQIQSFIQTLQNIHFSTVQLFKNALNHRHDANISCLSLCELSKKHKNKKKHHTKHKKPMTNKHTVTDNSDTYSVNVSIQHLKAIKSIKSYRRRSSVRSFGTLYSDQFRHSVAENYKKSITVNGQYNHNNATPNKLDIISFYHDNYIGQNEAFLSPFGIRPVIYADWTASGKAVHCVESYIQTQILPFYANTHTTTSITGAQTSKFRSESRSIILESIGGSHTKDVVIFTGSGATAAIYKLSRILHTNLSPHRTIVFISIYEHNSNIFIWKELGCKIIVIPEADTGGLDLSILEKHLRFYTCLRSGMRHKYNLLIGSFSAASNVSGIIAPIDQTTLLLHKYSALSFWDYAAAGPYLDINMTNGNNLLSKDAVFVSAHKYLGGPGCCGILCAKKSLFQNYIPVVPGGGTVFVAYGICDGEWQYLDNIHNIEEREEGGTPDIIGSIRASFVFMIRDHLTTQFIAEREEEYWTYFRQQCGSISNLVIMGNTQCRRLPIISFLVRYKEKYLHYNFVAALMNDLFGIQGRGGCACAGMYGRYVLDLCDEEINDVVLQLRENKNELARPGYFRINLHFTLNEEELKYIIAAVQFVCKYGWLFLPVYDVDIESGNFFHRDFKENTQLKSLLDLSFSKNGIETDGYKKVEGGDDGCDLNKYLEIAENHILKNLNQYLPAVADVDKFKNENKICHKNAWYWLPSELYQVVRNKINGICN